MKHILVVGRGLNQVLAPIVSLLMGAMLIVIFSATATRYLLGTSPVWGEEAARYMMVWVCFLGAPLAVGVGGHVGMQLFMERLPRRARIPIRFMSIVAIELFLCTVTVKSVALLLQILTQESPALRIPMYWVYAAAPTGCILLAFEFLMALIEGPVENEYAPFTTGGGV